MKYSRVSKEALSFTRVSCFNEATTRPRASVHLQNYVKRYLSKFSLKFDESINDDRHSGGGSGSFKISLGSLKPDNSRPEKLKPALEWERRIPVHFPFSPFFKTLYRPTCRSARSRVCVWVRESDAASKSNSPSENMASVVAASQGSSVAIGASPSDATRLLIS